MQETTARLLFMAVRWVKCLAPFQTLSLRDQLLLLQESWKDLFLLHFSQWSIPWDLTQGSRQRLSRESLHLGSSTLRTSPEDGTREFQLFRPQVIAARQAQLTAASEDKIADMEIKTMMEVMGRFRQLSPDGTECGCLKAIVLFKPGDYKILTKWMLRLIFSMKRNRR